MRNIMADSFAVPFKLPSTALRASTSLYIGSGGTPVKFIMIDVSGGNQNARLQVDAAADGSLYAIGCKGGIGSYRMTFYDGPFADCTNNGSVYAEPSSVVTKYLSLETIPDRRASVYIYRDATSSSLIGKFVGVLNNMATQLVSANDVVYLQVQVDMLGAWQQ